MPPSSLPKFFLISLLSSIITATIFTLSYSQCLDHQKTLLLELKNELISHSYNSRKLVQWNQTDDCCSWYGVECDGAGHVITLQLNDETISGGIGDSSSLFRLKYLEKLNMANNDFNNTQIPRGIQNLTYLTHLNLSNAAFAGQIPLEVSFLRRLVSLDISYTYWHLYDPASSDDLPFFDNRKIEPLKLEDPNLEMLIQNLAGLRELYLDGVNMSSQKSEWSHIISSYLPDLMNLSLCGCSVSGPLDRSLSQLHSLSILRLDGNNLSTAVPDFLANFSSLTTLSLSDCSLKGYFPETIFQIPTLQNLDLSLNQQLSGTIPPFTDQSRSLKSIVLLKTNFSGLIPSSISNHKTLSMIDLSFCKFTGQILPTLANLTELMYVDLSYNFFTDDSLSSTLFGGLSNLVSLNLGYNSFTGYIPQSLFSLPSLQKLFLGHNKFVGIVEDFHIVNVSHIDYLDLSSNQLEGPIPYSLLPLQRLEHLLLSHNLFSGAIQLEEILILSPNLYELDLSYNNLSVDTKINSSSSYHLVELSLASCNLYDFPEFIEHSVMNVLDLSNNRIAGEIPSWIWGTFLQTLNLSSNLLTGLQRPFNITATLYELDLSSNQLQGQLHLPFFEFHLPFFESPVVVTPLLMFLSVANNSLSGSIPPSLCNATRLRLLDLSLNKLSGDIPSCLLQNNEKFEVLNLGRNNISGHIPDSFSLNCRLQNLDLNNNTLQGKIPKSLENCKSLEYMNVGNNIINDSFPCMLSSSLRVLVLRSNRFHGVVTCHMSWPSLQIVDISSNNFSGSLESINFSSWRAMVIGTSDAGLRHNRSVSNFMQASHEFYYTVGVRLTMKGQEMELVKIWPDFTAVDFSCNNFQGEIPNAIGDLSSLLLLNLSHNALHGIIPKRFGSLSELESLDLSENQLTGRIPEELAGLTFLSFLNLSYNKLVGVIPNGPQFQTFSVDSFKGNSELCGFPLNISCMNNPDGNNLSPPENESMQSKREIEWEYVSAALGYVVGSGSIVWLLLFRRSFREKYFDKVEEVVEEIFNGRNKRRRHARRVVRNRVCRRQ